MVVPGATPGTDVRWEHLASVQHHAGRFGARAERVIGPTGTIAGRRVVNTRFLDRCRIVSAIWSTVIEHYKNSTRKRGTTMWNGSGMGCMGGMALMWIAGLLLLVGVIVLVVVLVKSFSGGSQNREKAEAGTDSGRGRQILEERYARGELSTEEYRERLWTLEEEIR